MTPKQQYEMIVESLRLVAAPAEQQVAVLPDFVVVTDEVATTFGDAFLLVPQLEQAGLVSASAAAALRTLDEFLESSPQDAAIAEPGSLKTHQYWAQARALAAEALKMLGEENRSPRLGGFTWVRG